MPLIQDFVNQRMGVATSSPQSTLDINGWMRIGQFTTSEINAITCDNNKLGTIVFDKDNDLVKICNKSGWNNLTDKSAPTWWNFTLPESTDVTNLTLTITCPTDAEGSNPVEMYVSWDITETPQWENCTNSKNVTLTNWNWNKNINLKWRDSLGNETDEINKITILNLLQWNTNDSNYSDEYIKTPVNGIYGLKYKDVDISWNLYTIKYPAIKKNNWSYSFMSDVWYNWSWQYYTSDNCERLCQYLGGSYSSQQDLGNPWSALSWMYTYYNAPYNIWGWVYYNTSNAPDWWSGWGGGTNDYGLAQCTCNL